MPQSVVVVGLVQSLFPRKQFYTKLFIYNTVVLEVLKRDHQITSDQVRAASVELSAYFGTKTSQS